MSDNQRIIPVNIENEMKTAYIDYSMSVIVSRALPDVRDGLKPVHRRVLYGMHELGLAYNKAPKKSARIVGEVLGKYHPHGDSSVYDAMVRMAQDWSLRYTLVNGQGNFGSMDGDSPAAMRYTEARLTKISDEILADINKETVDFRLNFDDTLEEPTVMPTRVPTLLMNGASGIAVGMATNIMPHNLSELCDGICAMVKNPEIAMEELLEYIKAPDFPTGGIIYGMTDVIEGFKTGRGRVVLRGKANIESSANGKETIIISEIPYQVNKANLVIKIAELVNEGKITGISDVRDESDRNGVRVVIEIKKDAMASVVLSKLYKYSPLQTSYGINNIALVKGRPMLLNLREMLKYFIEFRIEVIVRRTQYDLRKAQERAHILEGLLIALDHLDAVIALIRASETVDIAQAGLMQSFSLTEIQAKAILEMRLQRLTGLEREKIKKEYDELLQKILRYQEILDSREEQDLIVVEETQEIKEKYGDERKTEINYNDGEISIEDLIADDEVVISISNKGYIKRTPLLDYKSQSRGGRGSMGAKTREEDFVEHLFVASNHNYLLLFTEQGRCFWLRIFEIPEANKTSLGRVLQNIIALPKEDSVKAYIIIKNLTDQEFLENNYIVFCTKKGMIKKTSVEAFSRPRTNGIFAITIQEEDQLIEAKLTNGQSEILMANKNGRAIRFNESNVRPMGRTAAGVRGMKLDSTDDYVVGMVCVQSENQPTILVVSENGNGKRSLLEDYRTITRGGKGVKTLNISDKTGNLIAIKTVEDADDLLITNKSGIVIRTPVEELRVMGRATQGVKIIKLSPGDSIADVTVITAEQKKQEANPSLDEEE
jgi:DNA gyrase subunit A